MVYDGMDSATIRMSTSLAARDETLDFQVSSPLSTLSRMGWKVSVLALRTWRGRLKSIWSLLCRSLAPVLDRLSS